MITKTGISGLDEFLEGGYKNGAINIIYGPGASGKTTFCLCFSIEAIKTGKKVIYIDSENSFSVERLKQLAGEAYYEKILENLIIFKPKSFLEQFKIISKINEIVKNSNVGGIIVDTIGYHYRTQNKGGNLNAHMAKQLSDLKFFASEINIPVIITNQVYSDINDFGKIKLVGGNMVKNWSYCLIELSKNRKRKAIIHKPNKNEFAFEIINSGIELIR